MLSNCKRFLVLLPQIILILWLQSCGTENVNLTYVNDTNKRIIDKDIPNRLSFNKYTTENGLPENSAFNFTEDYIGNLWLTTQNGVARFSNNQFIAYTNSSVDTNTIYSKYNSITLLGDSSLIAYGSRGVAKYNQQKDIFERIFNAPKEVKFQDKQDENNQIDYDQFGYWYQSTEDSLYKCISSNNITHEFEIQGRIHQKITLNTFVLVQTILADGSHHIYKITINETSQSCTLIANSNQGATDMASITGNLYYHISNDSLYHSAEGYIVQVPNKTEVKSNHLFYNPKDETLTLFTSTDSVTFISQYANQQFITNPKGINGKFIAGTHTQHTELLVLIAEENGSYQGLKLYNCSSKLVEPIETNLSHYFHYYNRSTRNIYFDDRGHLFIGTWTNGIYHTNVNENNRFKYDLKTTELVFPFYEDNNSLYTFTKTGEFYKMNLANGKKEVIYSLTNNARVFACKHFDNKFYFAVGKNGYLVFNTDSKTFKETAVNQMYDGEEIIVTNLHVDSKNRTWLTSRYAKSDFGVLKLDGDQSKPYYINVSDTTISDGRVMDAFEYGGEMYFTAQAYGTHHLDETTGHFTCFEEDEEVQCSRAVIVRNNKIWCSTFTSGIAQMSYPNRKVEQVFSRENGLLPISWINQFTFLNDSMIITKGESPEWYILNINTKKYTAIPNYKESYWSQTFDVVPYQNNLTIMPATGGVVIYDFNTVVKPDISLIHLQSITAGQNKVDICDHKTVEQINVSFSQNNLSIQLQNIRPINPITKFEYRMIGYMDVWTTYDINSPIKLSNLSPGQYNLEIQNIGQNKEQSEISSILTISIAKPWWKTVWFYGVLVLIILGLGFVIFRLKTQQLRKRQLLLENKVEEATQEVLAQKRVIEDSHEELGLRHKEIKDSINYAERIQRSFLATKDLLDENLNDYFVLFEPKDVVSGDFYWAAQLNDGSFGYVTGDSTGHGVPGAIMSILNITSLEKAIEQETNTAEILNTTRSIIIDRLKNDGSEGGGKDGMDCTFLAVNSERTKVTFSAAHNPVWLIRNNELIEFKGDKYPVGRHDKETTSFTLQEFDIQKGDQIYTVTDGFHDQFGGPKGKKFMVKNMKQLILSLSHLTMKAQHTALLDKFEEWKGDIEQLDDVCVIGHRV